MALYRIRLSPQLTWNTPCTLRWYNPWLEVVGELPMSFNCLQLPSEDCMRLCGTVVKRSLRSVFYGTFKMFKISASEFNTMGMNRWKLVCVDEFLTMVTEGVVHGVYKVMTLSSFGVTWLYKSSVGRSRKIWRILGHGSAAK